MNTASKYTAALPSGEGYSLLQDDPEQVAFLVDGWEYYPGELLTPEALAGREAGQHTYSGEYPNFSHHLSSPYGTATYRLVLENRGGPRELSLYLPELLCAGRIYVNGTLAGEQGDVEPYKPHVVDGVYSFRAERATELVIQCANYSHYYSGLYYPPAVGTPTAISRMNIARMMVYGLLCFGSLAAAFSNLALWFFDRDKQNRRLGLLCLAFALRVSYPFLRSLGVPLVRPLYALEDFCAAAASLCAVTVVFPLFILPYAPLFINTYGAVLFFWKLLAGVYLLFLALRGLRAFAPLGRYLLCAAGLYGVSAAVSVLAANRFEPIRGAWPEEYGGFALVVGFGALMVRRGVLLAAENRRLTLHLHEEVDRKTRAMEALLQERRELLAHLIHDVKNPLAALQSYAELVRMGNVALDQETAGYLDALSERAGMVEARLDLLQGFSRGERGLLPLQPICLNGFLWQFYEDNRPDMELSGQTFVLELPETVLTVAGDEERLRSALENLCYNALSFTPEDGTVALSLRRERGWAVIDVTDTGAGIDPADLPRVFDRGFTHLPDGSGQGMGLFIVRNAALEHGGAAEVRSRVGGGSVFTLRLPLFEQ